jgi:hypothetical protein
MGAQSLESPNPNNFGTPPWESREKEPFGCNLRAELQGEPFVGKEATAPSVIREIKKVQGGEQAPRNGRLALLEDVAVKPFSLKGLLDAILVILIPKLMRGPDGPPGGHVDFGRSFPQLKEHSFEGVLAVEMFATSLGPEVVEQEALENVEGLTSIGETACVVAMEVGGVIFFFKDSLPKENERPGDVEAVVRPPFVPNAEESIPSLLGRGTFHETVLGRLRESLVAALAGRRDTHYLEPSTNQQPIVEGQPNKRPHLAWAGVMPHSGNDLSDRRVAEAQMLDESDDVRGVLLPPCILVSSLSRVTKEGGIAHVACLLPIPDSGIPR